MITEFKVMVIQVLISLKRRVHKLNENIKKEIEIININQSEMRNTLTEMKIH